MKKLILLSLFYFAIQSLIAQDHLISTYSSSPLTLNPATTGTFGNSNLRLHTDYDWNSYSGLLHENTVSVSVDKTMLKGKLGVGGDLSFEFGNDIIKSKGAMLSAAYNTGFLNDNYTFSVGMQAGLLQNSIDWNQIIFSEPLNPRYGGTNFDSTGPVMNQVLYPDFNLGVLVFRNPDNSKIIPWIGLSVSHLFRPNISLISLSNPIPRRLTIHAGADILVNEHIVITPLLLLAKQDVFSTLDLGGSAKYRESSFSLSLGGISKNIQYDFSKVKQLSLLAAASYKSFEIRIELLMKESGYPKQLIHSIGMIGLNWNLPGGKN